MNHDPQAEAQRRTERIAAFRLELAELEREHVLTLTPEQRAQVEAHHGSILAAAGRESAPGGGDSANRISWGMRIVSLLGAIAFFAALVLFLHRVWGFLPSAVHVALLTLLPLVLLGATEWSYRRRGSSYFAGLLGLATAAAFLLGVSALGTVLNLAPSPHALLAWSVFALLLAYAYDLRLLLAAGLTLACFYAGALGSTAQGRFWTGFPEQPVWLVPAAAVVYFWPAFTRHLPARDFEFVYRACGAVLGLAALLIVSKSGDLCCSTAIMAATEAYCQLAGLVACGGVIGHGLRLGCGGLVNIGAVAFVVYLFVRLHSWWWDWMPNYLFFLCLGAIALGLLAGFRRLRRRLTEGRAS